MSYSFIPLVASVALVLWMDFATSASLLLKICISGLLGVALACLFWVRQFALFGLFLCVGVGVFVLFYRMIQNASSDSGPD